MLTNSGEPGMHLPSVSTQPMPCAFLVDPPPIGASRVHVTCPSCRRILLKVDYSARLQGKRTKPNTKIREAAKRVCVAGADIKYPPPLSSSPIFYPPPLPFTSHSSHFSLPPLTYYLNTSSLFSDTPHYILIFFPPSYPLLLFQDVRLQAR